MTAEKTNRKEDKTKSKGSGPMGMPDLMGKCCPGEGAFSDCSTMMKGMMKMMGSRSCCAPKAKDAGPEEEKNERTDQ